MKKPANVLWLVVAGIVLSVFYIWYALGSDDFFSLGFAVVCLMTSLLLLFPYGLVRRLAVSLAIIFIFFMYIPMLMQGYYVDRLILTGVVFYFPLMVLAFAVIALLTTNEARRAFGDSERGESKPGNAEVISYCRIYLCYLSVMIVWRFIENGIWNPINSTDFLMQLSALGSMAAVCFFRLSFPASVWKLIFFVYLVWNGVCAVLVYKAGESFALNLDGFDKKILFYIDIWLPYMPLAAGLYIMGFTRNCVASVQKNG